MRDPRGVCHFRLRHSWLVDSHAWDERYSGKELVWSLGPNMFVEQYCADLPVGTAVDLAAGEGRNALWLAEKGWRARAVDFSEVALQRAQALADERLGDARSRFSTEVADLATWQPPVTGYDLVVVAYLQVPPSLRTPMLQAAAQAVAPGGHLLIVAHHPENIDRGYGGPPSADVNYTQSDVVRDIAESDLEILTAEEALRPVTTEDGPRTAIDTLVWAHRPTA